MSLLKYENFNIFYNNLNKILYNLNNENNKKYMEFIQNYCYENISDFLNFSEIQKNSFEEIWFYLKDNEKVLITDDIFLLFYFLDVCDNSYNILEYLKNNFIDFLNINKIKYEICYNYKKDFNNNLNNNFNSSNNYIVLDKNNFKYICVLRSDFIKKYYYNIDKIDLEYCKYIKKDENYNLNDLPVKDMTSDIVGWIYIASNNDCQINNIYKIGVTKVLKKFNEFYIIKIFDCNKPKNIFKIIQNTLKNFKYNKELYLINIFNLINIIKFIIENNNKTNNINFLNMNFLNPYENSSVFLKPLDIENENIKIIHKEIFKYLDKVKNNDIIFKNNLINSLYLNFTKTQIWLEFKKLFNWNIKSKYIIYNNKKIFVIYN